MRMFLIIATALGVLWAAGAGAQPGPSIEDRFRSVDQTLTRIEGVLEGGEAGVVELERLRGTINTVLDTLAPLREDAESAATPLRAQLDKLGAAPTDGSADPPQVARQRAGLNEALLTHQDVIQRVELALVRGRALDNAILTERRARFTQVLMTRGPSPVSQGIVSATLTALPDLANRIGQEATTRLRFAGIIGQVADRLALPALMAIAALVMAFGVRRWLVRHLTRDLDEVEAGVAQIGRGVLLTVARLLLPALALGMAMLAVGYSGLLGPTGTAAVRGMAFTLACVIGAYGLGGAFFSPSTPKLRLSGLDNRAARGAHRWTMAMAAAVGLDRMLVVHGPQLDLSVESMIGLNAALLIVGGISLWMLVTIARIGRTAPRPVPEGEDDPEPVEPRLDLLRYLRPVLKAAAVVAPLLALAGFYGASRFVFYPVVFTGALVALCVILYRFVSALVDTVASPAMRDPRQTDGETQADSGPQRLRLIPVIVAIFLGSAALPVLALIWGADTADLSRVWDQAVEGFTVGDITLSPLDFVMFIVVFSIGYMLTRIAQGLTRRSILPLMRLDAGGRSAILAGIGYTGILLSALAAVSSTELDLTNLAIVAGALSVGIGFGLQNIVNNFVSGIILLIERPIKEGDWVEIAGTHGTVQRVNVRSTEIQTFDRSTMFVPNADLISGTVTNWTHGNLNGRLIVGVGAAYGADARAVEKILLEIARAHPMLLRRPAPYVVFIGFGASSIDFEIRGVLSDVNWILNVASDLRFEIYHRFNEEGIEIPFAQHDVYIKNAAALGLPGTPPASDPPQ